jgi:hypothetical protein
VSDPVPLPEGQSQVGDAELSFKSHYLLITSSTSIGTRTVSRCNRWHCGGNHDSGHRVGRSGRLNM